MSEGVTGQLPLKSARFLPPNRQVRNMCSLRHEGLKATKTLDFSALVVLLPWSWDLDSRGSACGWLRLPLAGPYRCWEPPLDLSGR